MKELIAPLFIVVFVVLVTISFAGKVTGRSVGIDHLKADLADLSEILPPDANISLSIKGDSFDDFVNAYYLMRYALAPRYLSPVANECDTVLTFFGKVPTADEFLAVIHNRKVIWEKRNGRVIVVLTCSK